MSILEARRLHKRYESEGVPVNAVNGVDLALEPGEFVALVGPSGCGKSTLLHLLGGLDTPTDGDVLLDGCSLPAMEDRERTLVRRRRIGFVFQFFNLVPVLTALENVELPGTIDGQGTRATERARSLLDLVGLSERANHLPSRLSGGEQQRVALARALFHEPAVLLADEPTGNLDRDSGNRVVELLRAANHDLHQTVLVVTHDAAVAAQADRTIELRDGQVVPRPNGDDHRTTLAR